MVACFRVNLGKSTTKKKEIERVYVRKASFSKGASRARSLLWAESGFHALCRREQITLNQVEGGIRK